MPSLDKVELCSLLLGVWPNEKDIPATVAAPSALLVSILPKDTPGFASPPPPEWLAEGNSNEEDEDAELFEVSFFAPPSRSLPFVLLPFCSHQS